MIVCNNNTCGAAELTESKVWFKSLCGTFSWQLGEEEATVWQQPSPACATAFSIEVGFGNIHLFKYVQ